MPDVTTLQKLPDSSTYPLRRDGIDPVPALSEAQAKEPVTKLARILGIDVWLVTGYAEAKGVLADAKTYSNDMRHLLGTRERSDAEGIGGLGMTDPPDHTRLRGLLTPEFTMRRLARVQSMIDSIVDNALNELERWGPEVDLVPHFGFAVPFEVICELLGMPDTEREAFHEMGVARFDLSQGGAGVFGAATESRTFLIDAVRRERANPGEGMMGALVRDHGDSFDDVELGGLVDGVFLGGYETSASMLSMGAYLLLQNPDAWQLLQTGTSDEIDQVIEELLRLLCPVQVAFPRFAREPHTLGDHQVGKGDVVIVSLSAANRDPSVITDPNDFNLRSERTSHLAFGHGLHRCVGAELARMELRAALPGLARRFPDLAIAPDTEVAFRELSVVHSIDKLQVQLNSPVPVA